MRPELSQLEKISNYLNGEMSAEQVDAFARELSQNSELRDLLSQQKDVIRAAKRKALRAEIQAVAAGSGAGGGTSAFSTGWYILGGAIIVGLGSVLYFTNLDSNDVDQAISDLNLSESDRSEMGLMDSTDMATNRDVDLSLDKGQEELVKEEPETIFSSVAFYADNTEEDNSDFENSLDLNRDKSMDHAISDNEGKLVIKEKTKPSDGRQENDVLEYENKASRASFPGGNIAMKDFMDKNLRYPKSASNKGIEAVVQCDFQISEDGIIQNINAELKKMSEEDGMPFSDVRELFNKKLADAFIRNATHVLRTMPTWNPSTNSAGTPVVSTQRMYFNYDLKRGCLAYQLSEDFELPVRQRE